MNVKVHLKVYETKKSFCLKKAQLFIPPTIFQNFFFITWHVLSKQRQEILTSSFYKRPDKL